MQAVTLPAVAGWRWLAAAHALFRRSPATLIGLSVAYWAVLLLAGVIPVVGSIIGSVIAPALSVGVMNACRLIDRGQRPGIDSLFSAFRHNPRSLFALGALYLAVTLLILGITSLVDGGTLLRLMTVGKVEVEELASDRFQWAAQLALLLLAPVVMAWWYAPMLACWHGTPVTKALFFSFIACWRNWKAFLAYSGAVLLLALPPLFLVALLAGGSGAGAGIAALLALPVVVFLAPLFFASFYVSYRDVFVVAEPPPPTVDLSV